MSRNILKICLNACLVLFFIMSSTIAQTTQEKIEQMRIRRTELEKQVKASEELLTLTDRDISSKVNSLSLISAQLYERRKLLESTKKDIQTLTQDSVKLEKQLIVLQDEYELCKNRYAQACRFFQHQSHSFNSVMFLFAADNFKQLTRRFRYIKEYSGSVENLAEEIVRKQVQITDKQQEIAVLKEEKIALKISQSVIESQLATQEVFQQKIISDLRSKSSSLKNDIAKRQKEMNSLSQEIDRQIAQALKEELEREEAIQKTETHTQTLRRQEKDIKLTGSFENNKGRLPMPITGPYLIVGNFGLHNVAGMKEIKLTNLGIDIQGEKEAKARSVFDGIVTAVFQQGKGLIGVLIRHGEYISVYCNFSRVGVKKGDNIKTKEIIGDIQLDETGRTLLHFELRKETTKLNPSDWLEN